MINPRKQKECYDIINAVGDKCKFIIVFGSSTQLSCNKDSDTDLCIALKNYHEKTEVSLVISKLCENGCDIIWPEWDGLDEKLKEEIIKKGVQIV